MRRKIWSVVAPAYVTVLLVVFYLSKGKVLSIYFDIAMWMFFVPVSIFIVFFAWLMVQEIYDAIDRKE